MSALSIVLLTLAKIGKGLVKNPITNLLDVQVSNDSNNQLAYGSDNGLYVPPSSMGTLTEYPSVPATQPTDAMWLINQPATQGGMILGGMILQAPIPQTFTLQVNTSAGVKSVQVK